MSTSSAVFVHLLTGYYETTNEYIYVLQASSYSILRKVTNGASADVASAFTPGVYSASTYRVFLFSWCGGQISAGPQGQETMLTWKDLSPLSITYVMMESAVDNAQTWFMTNNLADYWYPAGNVTTTGDPRGHIIRKLPASLSSTNFSTVFNCKGLSDCDLFFLGDENFLNYYRVCIGCFYNGKSMISYKRGSTGEVVSVANILAINALFCTKEILTLEPIFIQNVVSLFSIQLCFGHFRC
nr:uncharacterized protein LOC123770952 [Procambarus clarkii]